MQYNKKKALNSEMMYFSPYFKTHALKEKEKKNGSMAFYAENTNLLSLLCHPKNLH